MGNFVNIKSFVGKVSLRATAIFLFAFLIFIAVSSLILYRVSKQYEVSKLENEVVYLTGDIQAKIDELRSDVSFLASVPSIQGIVRASFHENIDPKDGSSMEQWKSRLQIIFHEMLDAKKNYLQLRYIGVSNNGKEIVRQERKGLKLVEIPESWLQEKAKEIYFKEISKLEPYNVYLSRINLNREFGKIEEPKRLVIRAGMPIYGPNKILFGMVVINMLADELFSSLFEVKKYGKSISLIDDQWTLLKEVLPNQNIGLPFQSFKSTQEVDSFFKEGSADLSSVMFDRFLISLKKIYYDEQSPSRFLGIALATPMTNLYENVYGSVQLQALSLFFLLILIVIGLILYLRTEIQPVYDLKVLADQYNEGGFQKIPSVILNRNDEIAELGLALQKMSKDISEKESKLEENIKKFQALFQNSPDAYLLMDLNGGKVLDCNEAAEKMLKGGKDEIIGLTPEKMSPKIQLGGRTSKELVPEKIEKVIKEGHHRFEWLHQRFDGEVFPCDVNISLVSYESKKVLLVGWRDISSRVQLENDLRQEKIRALKDSEFKSQFLARMSHDIRTPLNSILGMTEVLEETNLDDNQKAYLNTIGVSGKSLLELINDILDLSKIESGELVLNESEFDLEDLFIGVVDIISVQARKKNTDIIISKLTVLARLVKSDQMKIRQVLTNLLGNAAKFTENGLISIDIEIKKPAAMKVQIKDSGVGIPQEKLKVIFESYKQLKTESVKNVGGTGLGLSICKLLVERMGGYIQAESTPGFGSVFTFEVPIRFGTLIYKNKEEKNILKNKKILALLESNYEKSYFTTVVESFGGDVYFIDKHKLLKELESKSYDCYLFESGKDSIEIFDTLKDRNQIAKKSILLLPAGKHSKSEVVKAREVHMASVLIRPFKSRSLAKMIHDISEGIELNSMNSPSQSHLDELAGVSILIADDVPSNRALLKAFLKNTGAYVVMAKDGREAFDLFKENDFDIVFMDMYMPILSGIQAVTKIRKWEVENDKKPTPILALTADAFDVDAKQMNEAGCDGILTKPIRKLTFLSNIHKFVSKKDLNSLEVYAQNVESHIDSKAVDELMSLFDQEGFESFSKDAFRSMENIIIQIHSHTDQEDFSKLSEQFHALRGLAGNVGAKTLAKKCARAEEAAKAASTTFPYKEAIEDLKEEMQKVEEILIELISKKQPA